MPEVSISSVSEPTSEVRALIAELDRSLAQEYSPEEQHGLSIEGIFAPHVRFFVAHDGAMAVGCGGVAVFGGFAEVKRMYVREGARGRGVARALLTRIESETRNSGLTILRLETGDRLTAAIRLYEQAGFQRCGAFGDYVSLEPLSIARSLFYEKRLAP